MIEKLVAFEERLTRVEAALLVGVVIFMLLLAVYNVFYRNALIPLQVSVVESATVEVEVPIEPDSSSGSAEGDSGFGGGFGQPDEPTGGFGGGFGDESAKGDDEASGFGGGFGDDAEDVAEPPDAEGDDGAAGFGGGFGDDAEDVAEPADAEGDDGAAGFGGGFGEDSADESSEPSADGAEGFGGGFGDAEGEEGDAAGGFGGGFGEDSTESDRATADTAVDEKPKFRIERRPPEDGSFAKGLADAIDAVKLEWIDVVLRQLVLVIGFLGSMLATRRRKHITIDALSKVLPVKALPWTQVLTNTLSIVVCIFLALAGWGLVEIGLEFPKELTWFADEWIFQLVFPVGFGLLSFHFGVRLIESVAWGITGEPVGTIELEPRPTAISATAGDIDLDDGDLVGSSTGAEALELAAADAEHGDEVQGTGEAVEGDDSEEVSQ